MGNQTVKNILFVAISGREWIGGLYYINNILYTLDIDNRTDIKATVLVSAEHKQLFDGFKTIEVIELKDNNYAMRKLLRIISIRLFKRDFLPQIKEIVEEKKIDAIYPAIHYPFNGVAEKCIGWIPDFQEFHYPEWFTPIEKLYRKTRTAFYAKHMKRVVLSSETAKQDFYQIQPKINATLGIVHFISNIEKRLSCVCDQEFINQTKDKYQITERHFIVCNQFWKHKNHRVVFEAIAILKEKEQLSDVTFVFTGSRKDYRNQGYFKFLFKNKKNDKSNACYDAVMQIAKKHGFENQVNCVGLIERNEQLALMHSAIAVIQPSLFEGWGTVVEDAKVLDCEMALSDIAIHREQAKEGSAFFDPHDAQTLANVMVEIADRPERKKDAQKGLAASKTQAREYAQVFMALAEGE